MPRYEITERSAPARGCVYRRPVHLRIMDLAETKVTLETRSPWHVSRGEGDIVCEWRNVDSRYNGPKSAYGQALAEAQELLEKLNND